MLGKVVELASQLKGLEGVKKPEYELEEV